MLASLRAFMLKTPVRVVSGVFAVYLLFGWFAFGPLAKWGAETFVADKSGHRLVLDEPSFDPLRLELTVTNLALLAPDGQPLAGFKELRIDFAASSLLRFAWTFDEIRLSGLAGRLELLPGGGLNWTAFLDAFKKDEEEEDTGLPRLLVRHFELKDGRFDFADRTLAPAFEMGFAPLELTLDDLSTLPDDKGAYQVSARTLLGGRLRWKGDVGLKPVSVTGAFALEGLELAQLMPYLKGRLNIATPEGTAGFATQYRVVYANKRLGVNLDHLGATVDGLRLRGANAAEPALVLDRLAVRDGRFDLEKRTFELAEVALQGGQVRLGRQADGRFDLQDWFPPTPAPKPVSVGPAWTRPTAEPPAVAAPWRLGLARFSLDGVGIHVLDRTFVRPLAIEVANLGLAFKADARVGAGAPEVDLTEGHARLDRIALASADQPLFALDTLALEGIRLDLADRHAEATRLALQGGQVNATRAADGRIALLDAVAPVARSTPVRTVPEPAGPGWSWRLDRAELAAFRLAVRDEAVSPVAGLTLERIDASLSGLTDDLRAAVPVSLSVRVKEGGRLGARGKLVPAKGALDAEIELAGLNLMPAQPYLAQRANVNLVSGAVASRGRLTVGDRLAYRGGFAIADLRINESATGDRVLAWQRLASDDLAVSPEALAIGEVKVEGLGLKLVIDKDKTLNLKRLMKTPAAPATTGPAATAPPEAAKPGLKLAIDRINVAANELDFADESLALPFGTRIHGLKGAIDGIGLDKGKPAQLELDGLVDDYGLARAVGQIDLLDPTGFTDIKVVFRNVEMNRLTPYSATFAGRRIASGKLSLDLEYKIKQRQLAGENQIVMNRLTLGERVESPTAKNLPLDLAIAILEDADGVIDLGLPVSGSLDDPQFSYGGIVWKAIVNVLGKIVTAPFRALGKLLGIEGDKLEKVVFDPGEAALLPPEREKLKQLAQALAKRPGLALTATPAWHPVADRAAIKEARLRRALAEAMGRKLAPGEDPGPVSTAQPKTREALEKVYAARLGAEALAILKAKFAQANPEPPPTSTAGKLLSRLSGLMKAKPEPLTESESTRLKGADLHDVIYRTLLDRETVADTELAALAGERGEAIRQALQAHGVAVDRLALQAAETAGGEGRDVVVKLTLGVARTPAKP